MISYLVDKQNLTGINDKDQTGLDENDPDKLAAQIAATEMELVKLQEYATQNQINRSKAQMKAVQIAQKILDENQSTSEEIRSYRRSPFWQKQVAKNRSLRT